MKIFYNNVMEDLPEDFMTLQDLAKWKELPLQGTAIAINDKLIKRDEWLVTQLKDNDSIVVITAAFGG